jgi:hypothetical protein
VFEDAKFTPVESITHSSKFFLEFRVELQKCNVAFKDAQIQFDKPF